MKDNMISFYSGAGIGLLIGILMGLAVSPTVGVIIGALSSALAVLLGLNDKHFSPAKAIRIGSFGFACVLGALLGIFIRVNKLLAPDITAQFEAYKKIGYSDEQARDFIAYERFGILNKDWVIHQPNIPETTVDTVVSVENIVAEKGKNDSQDKEETQKESTSAREKTRPAPTNTFNAPLAQVSSTVGLFSAEGPSESDCEELNEVNEESSLPYILQNFDLLEGFWPKLATTIGNELDEAHQKTTLLALKNCLCAEETVVFKDAECDQLTTLDKKTISTNALFKQFHKLGGPWKKLATTVKDKVPSSEQKKVLLILINSTCDEKK